MDRERLAEHLHETLGYGEQVNFSADTSNEHTELFITKSTDQIVVPQRALQPRTNGGEHHVVRLVLHLIGVRCQSVEVNDQHRAEQGSVVDCKRTVHPIEKR